MRPLYETDSFLTEFSATVDSCYPKNGEWIVKLAETAFYPGGGGQPCDRGTLGGVNVLSVEEKNGVILHHCDGPLEPRTSVNGAIDFARRFSLMQQHSGEHIVSGIAHSLYGCENVGFHMGADAITIDFDKELTWEQLMEVERRANHYIWEGHPCTVTIPRPEELAALDYRSKKELTGQVRIVTFPGADCCACCGTHVANTGQIGLVKILSVQKFRDGVRVELLCGGQALDYLGRTYEENRSVSQHLSAKPLETAAAAERLLGEVESLKLALSKARQAQFSAIARTLQGQAEVLLVEDDLAPDDLRRLADTLLSAGCGRVVCLSGGDGAGYKYAVGERGGDLRPFVKAMNDALNGRGGGKPDFVQGSLSASRKEIEGFFQNNPI